MKLNKNDKVRLNNGKLGVVAANPYMVVSENERYVEVVVGGAIETVKINSVEVI